MNGASSRVSTRKRGGVYGPRSFEELIREERHCIDASAGRGTGRKPDIEGDAEKRAADDVIPLAGPADEPWVAFTDRDYFGLSLSGGGIRSATFNLGLLQALEQNGVLCHLDYLSTVSGGGYIGGFWTAWRHQQGSVEASAHGRGTASLFPLSSANLEPLAGNDLKDAPAQLRQSCDRREPPQIRHLREFSRFLMPRVGLQHAETWGGVVALLGGLVPSLLAAIALLAATVYAWFALTFFLAWLPWHDGRVIAGAFALLTLGVHWAKEQSYRKLNRSCQRASATFETLLLMVGSSAAAGTLFWELREHWLRVPNDEWARTVQTTWLSDRVPNFSCPYSVAVAVFIAPITWAMTGLGLALLRGLGARFWQSAKRQILWVSACERTAARHLVLALSVAALGLVWELARYLLQNKWGYSLTVTGSVGFAALFALLRSWLNKSNEPTHGSKMWDWFATVGKPLLPQLLANAAFLFILTGVTLTIQVHGSATEVKQGIAVSIAVLLATAVLFDPARTGLHDFYRSRIARCFLGAACVEPNGRLQRVTPEQPDDDLTFQTIRGKDGTPLRPLHLVCCAANSLSGDVLGSLYRGARSAVISPLAISIGRHCVRPTSELRLSSALTASAAAFNSQMGGVSMRLGPAVAFLMSALSLRLGLWVAHPRSNAAYGSSYLPGLRFFFEMLGLTKCDPVEHESDLGIFGRQVHLSDGGHFENLGLYELIRRHCRYVIVSDCGADPNSLFDDLGNAIRRIREDFNIEIEMDTSPLRPGATGDAQQHAVVGTIHYDGLSGTDKGMLLFFKPTLTGDEPPDVLQYRVRNSAFPHESTGDQFYDEAQWESYRRLGEHAVHGVLRNLGGIECQGNPIDRLFLEASQRWHPQLERQQEIYRDLNRRCGEFLANVEANAPAKLRAELFPEVVAAGKTEGAEPYDPTPDETTRILFFLMLGLQIMEDAWVTVKLDAFWSHPLNEGWMHYFERWASTPSLRCFWPILRPMYSPGFRDFVRDRFNLRLNEPARNEHNCGAKLQLRPCEPAADASSGLAQTLTATGGLVWQQWQRRRGAPATDGKAALLYEMTLDELEGPPLNPLQVGLLLYKRQNQPNGEVVEWRVSELYVPNILDGAGIVARFLDAVIRHFERINSVCEIIVVLDDENDLPPASSSSRPKTVLDAAGRQARIHDISFYKSRGFAYWRSSGDAGQPRALRLDLRQLRARENQERVVK